MAVLRTEDSWTTEPLCPRGTAIRSPGFQPGDARFGTGMCAMTFTGPEQPDTAAAFARPYVVSWNLTYRCNLACEHCYLDAGPNKVKTPAFSDRSELSTEQCCRVIDEIAAFAPESVTILTGGEPLLRRDIIEIIRYGVAKNLWVVVGTNGVKITENLARLLQAEGVRGLALSL